MEHTFKGVYFGDEIDKIALAGILDGAPRFVVARTGFKVATYPADGSPPILHTDTIADASKTAFDSDWFGTAVILASGSAVPSTTNVIWEVEYEGGWGSGLPAGVIATWDDPGYTPIPFVFCNGAVWGPSCNDSWVTPIPGNGLALSNRFHTVVTPTRLGVVQGNPWNGYSIPTVAMQYVVLGVSVM